MVLKVFEPLKFYCILLDLVTFHNIHFFVEISMKKVLYCFCFHKDKQTNAFLDVFTNTKGGIFVMFSYHSCVQMSCLTVFEFMNLFDLLNCC